MCAYPRGEGACFAQDRKACVSIRGEDTYVRIPEAIMGFHN